MVSVAKAGQWNQIPDKRLGNIYECHVFKNETRLVLFTDRIIKQKELLTEEICSNKFENGMTEIELNLANL